MDLNDTPEQAEYRAKIRAWLDEHKDEAPILQGEGAITDPDEVAREQRKWQAKLAEGGLAGATWPTEYGGQGVGPIESVIINQELQRAGVPNVFDVIGVGMLGPTIIAHGTEEQKDRYLGPMLNGDEVWCQMFSEPAAGSDLAAVQTRAVQQDDGSWKLNGQKVWTTNAQYATYGLMLARTNPEAHKHKGMTMFILPMDAEGVTIRGLRQISGEAEFNEVFLDDVVVDADSVVGGVDNGWGTGLTTLMFERLTIGLGSSSFGYRGRRFAEALGEDEVASRNSEVRHDFGELAAELEAVRWSGYRAISALQGGQIPGPEFGLAKITTVNCAIKAGDLVADVIGPEALAEESEWAYMISFLPGLKSAGGTEEILRNTIGERVLGLPPEPRLDKGVPFSELRAIEKEGGRGMNLELSDEQEFLREAAAGALSRVKTVEEAREALEDEAALTDLWPVAAEAGWLGLLVSEENGGAGLSAYDAMLVAEEAGKVLAGAPLLGTLPASMLMDLGGDDRVAAVAAGETKAAWLPAAPPSSVEDQWTVDPIEGMDRPEAPQAEVKGDEVTFTGTVAWAPDAGEADLLVVVGLDGGSPVAGVVEASADGVTVESGWRYDATRKLGTITLAEATGRKLDVDEDEISRAWYLTQALIAAESVGTVATALETSVEYAKERYTFGRAIGSYQAIKHSLVEIMRRLDNARSLCVYAGYAFADSPAEIPYAAAAARSVAGGALDYAGRQQIQVHGGIGATWEHDAPLYFRRSQLNRRLVGGTSMATDRVAEELFQGRGPVAAV